MHLARLRFAAALTLLCAGLVPALAAPQTGAYAARMCVTLRDQAPSCGDALARLAGHRLQVQVSDVVYRLNLQPRRARGELEVLLMHGTMQIDGFSAPYEWVGRALQFADADKQTRYQVQLGARQREPTPR